MNEFRNNVKGDEFLLIEKSFSAIKNGISIKDNLHKIELAIKRQFGLCVNIQISENNSGEFYGMAVFPTIKTIDKVIKDIVDDSCKSEKVVETWSSSKEWYIEIDSILIDDMGLNASPSEMVAVLLHEIGHVVYSNTIPYKIWKILRMKIAELNYTTKQLVSNEKIRKLFNISIIEAVTTTNYIYFDRQTEKIADDFVVKCGYGKDLETFIDKLIKLTGNSLINRSDDEMTREITSTINWSIVNIKELEFRKKNLKIALRTEMLKTPSLYVKKVIQDIYYTFFGDVEDKYRVLLSENYMDTPRDLYSEMKADQALSQLYKKIVTESGNSMFDKNGKIKKINQNDIDILYVEAERIETVDDKIYLLDKLYYQLELVDKALDYIDSNDKHMTTKVQQSKTTLVSYKEQLEDIRSKILATKIVDKEYGVFLKYPDGYKG